MSTLAEIEQAAETLPAAQQQQLLLFIAAKLRAGAVLPEPRLFASEQLRVWMDEDEDDLRRFDAGQ